MAKDYRSSHYAGFDLTFNTKEAITIKKIEKYYAQGTKINLRELVR